MKSIERFLEHVKTETKEHGINLKLMNSRRVKCDGIHVGGYFDDEDTMSLVVAMKHETWLEIMVHEYSHFEQWISGTFKDLDETNDLDKWLAGKDYEQEYINGLISEIRDMEHDCEKRSVKNICKFKLPIDIKLYSKKANAYLHFYNWVAMRRRWSKTGRESYSIPEITKAMNPTIDSDVSNTPRIIIELFDRYL